MPPQEPTREELMTELEQLRQRVSALEAAAALPSSLQPGYDFLLQAVNTMAQGLTVTDADSRFVFVNHAYARLLGFTPKELIGRRPEEFVVPEDVAVLDEAQRQREAGKTTSYETRILRRDGTLAHVTITAAPRSPNGPFAGAIAAVTDLTERTRAEQALCDSEMRYRAMIEASIDAIFLETLDGRILDCNSAAARIHLYSREEMLRLHVADLVPPQVSTDIGQILKMESSEGGAWFKSFNRRKNGEIFPVEVSTQAVSIDGEPRLIAYVRDITERERTAEALSRRVQALSILYQTSLEITSLTNLPELLRAIVERARALVDAPMGAFYLAHPEAETLEMVISSNLPQDYTGTLLRYGEGLAGRIAQSGQSMQVPAYNRWEGRAAVFKNVAFSNMMGVPLKIGDHLLGVITIAEDRRSEPFSGEDIQMVELLANQAAVAMHNSQLFAAAQSELDERRRAEERLTEANTSLARQLRFNEALLSAMPIPVFFKDAQGRYTGCNLAFAEQLGLTPAQIQGKTVFDVWPPELAEVYHHKDQEILAHPGHQVYEAPVRGKDGQIFDAIFARDVIYDETGRPSGILGAYIDISERKRAERVQYALYQISEAALVSKNLSELCALIHRVILGLMPARNFYIGLLDVPTSTISFPYFVDESDPAPPSSTRITPSLTAYVIRTGQPLLATPPVWKDLLARGEIEMRGTPPVDWLGIPLKVNDVTIGTMTVQTYTEQERLTPAHQELLSFVSNQVAMTLERLRAHQEIQLFNQVLEERVRQRTAQLEDANRELESFAYSVSHDLRAPLRAVDGYAHILLEDYAADGSSPNRLDEEGSRILRSISSNVQKMNRLITDILSLSRITRAEMNLVNMDMTALARTAFNEAAPPATLALFSFTLDPLPRACGDPGLVRQVWANLLSNAVKYTLPQSARAIHISGEVRGELCVYCVRDTGVGFDPNHAHKLFGVFQRLHSAAEFEGTGVGLAIVQRIVRRHGGQVWAEGAPGQGAAFYFSLPSCPPEEKTGGQ